MITGFGFACCIVVGVGIVITIVMSFCWVGAKVESGVYNEQFGTHYTTKQFFWAGDTIKSYLQEGKQRVINIKGLK